MMAPHPSQRNVHHMPDIILIHGALGALDQLEPLAGALASRARIHRVELQGHGATPGPSSYTTGGFVANVRDFMTGQEIARASIFGYSMGGYVALTMANEFPELVAAVATLGTKLAWNPDVAIRETSRLNAPTIRAKVPRFAEALEKRHAGGGGWEAVLQKTAAYMTSLGGSPEINATALAKISQPTRLMVGDRDAVVTVEETRDAARALPNGQFAVLPNTVHPFEQVRLPLLVSHLTDFFDAVG